MPESPRRRPSGQLLRNAQSSTERLGNEDADAFAAVRALLVGEEQSTLDELRERIAEIERTTADLDKRRDDVAEVLGDALRQASLSDADKIEDVLNPAIGEGIRHQLKTERPAMVAALVPMVGTLVAGAVAESIGKLSTSINERFEKLFSFDGLKLAMRAKISGVSVNEMLLAELRNSEVERLYLFERQTEKLVFCWPKPDEGDALTDTIAEEVLRAVLSFSGGILEAGDHGLRSIAIRDRHLVLQANDTHIIVIEVSGSLPDHRRADLNDACFEILNFSADLTGNLIDVDIDQEAMGLFAARVVKNGSSQKSKKRRMNPAICLAAILALALIGYIGWQSYDEYRINARAEAVKAQIAASFPSDSLMLSVKAERDTGTIAVMGVALSDGDRAAIREQAATLAQPYTLAFNLVNDDPDQATPRLGEIEASIDQLRRYAEQTNGTLQAINAKAIKAQAQADALWNAQRQLGEWVSSHAIFFSEGTSYKTDEQVSRHLGTLVALLQRVPDRPLRIIGYSDAIGSYSNNRRLALDRAERVAAELTAQGIRPERLILLGKTSQDKLISAINGPNSPNRRVEFELGFVGE